MAIMVAFLAAVLGAIVSSGGMYAQQFDLDRLEMKPDGYDGVVAYARAKRAQVVMADARTGTANYGPAEFGPGSSTTAGRHRHLRGNAGDGCPSGQA